MTVRETCTECGFDSDAWRVADAASFFRALADWWRLATADVSDADLNRRPAPTTWSALEYGVHSALVTAMHVYGMNLVAEGVALPEVPDIGGATSTDPALDLDPARVIGDIERESEALLADGPQNPEGIGLLLHAAHDATHHMMDVGRGLAAIGAGMPAQTGSVAQINTSNGGVPKLPVDHAHVGHDGLSGDHQNDRKHHGRPFQALCLWSTEVIDELAGLGHPIGYGSAGENLTLTGIDWTAMRPGARLRIGSVLAEVSFASTPCAKQSGWFTDGDFRRIDYDRNPNWTRWYAWVREPGEVRPGDPLSTE